jgi:hypothetical protein
MAKVLPALREEFVALVWPFGFFFVCFNALALTVALMSPGHDFSLLAHGAATVGALVVAKAVLVADHLALVNRYPDRPLIWNVVWKTLLYTLVAIVFRMLERVLAAATNEAGFAAGLREVVQALDWQHLLAVQMWLVILFFVYTSAREVFRVIGLDRARAMFFEAAPLARTEASAER